MAELQRKFKAQGLVILGINVEDAETARGFMRQNAYTFSTLIDWNVADLYQVEALPSVFIIGRNGELVSRFVGATSNSTMREAIASAGIKAGRRDA